MILENEKIFKLTDEMLQVLEDLMSLLVFCYCLISLFSTNIGKNKISK